MKQCPRCKHWRLYDCRCEGFQVAKPCQGKVAENQWQDWYALNAEDAAEEFAERSDSDGDYTIIRAGEAEIWVRDAENKVTIFDITAETVPSYTARERTAVSESGDPT